MKLRRDHLGVLVYFGSGYKVGFSWVHGGDGSTSKSSAVIAARHHPKSITWQWALYWQRPSWSFRSFVPSFWINQRRDYFRIYFPIIIGGLSFSYQGHMWRRA